MLNLNLNDDVLLTADYSIDTLVFMNSATHIYSEIKLNDDLVLFGNNNKGKTSSLVALKLALYPEVNFNECYRKFHFESKHKQYSKEESYLYYFPHADSYILMESTNPNKTFCTLLYKAGNYEYHRIFIASGYKDIKDWFWNESTKTFQDNIEIKAIIQRLKDAKIPFKQVTKRDELKRIMFGGMASTDSQFSTIPLKTNDDNSIQAFTNIFDIAFSQSADTEKLPKAIATIIEMRRNREQEKLNANFHEVQDVYFRLHDEKQSLKKYANQQDKFNLLKDRFVELHAKNLAFNNDFFHAHNVLLNVLGKTTNHVAQLQTSANSLQRIASDKKHTVNSLEKSINHLSGRLESLRTTLVAKQGEINQVELILNETSVNRPELTDKDDIFNLTCFDIENELRRNKELLRAINNIDVSQAQLKDHAHKKEVATAKLKNLEIAQNNIASLALFQLDDNVSAILKSLVKGFDLVSTPISPAEKQTLTDFANLFERADNRITFHGIPLEKVVASDFNKNSEVSNIEANIKKTKREIEDHTKTISDLQKILVDSNKNLGEEKKKNIERQISDLQHKLDMINGYNLTIKDFGELQQQLEAAQQEFDTLGKNLELAKNDYQQANGEYIACFNKLENTNNRQLDFKRKSEKLSSILNSFSLETLTNIEQEHKINNMSEDELFYTADTISFDQIDALVRTARDNLRDFASIKSKLLSLMNLLDNDAVDKDKDFTTLKEMEFIIGSYQNIFQTLALKEISINNEIAGHNFFLNSMLSEIKQGYGLINDTVKSINQLLMQYEVSNFKAVQLNVVTRSDFGNILKLSEKLDLTQPELAERSFYDSLMSFINAATHKNTNRLRMADIIESVTYDYVQHNGERVTSGQSGGTTTTANCFIISCLLNLIFEKYSNFKMPIIIDEISQIDEDNLISLVSQIHALGFSIFCATPTETTIAQIHIGRWIDLDACTYGEFEGDERLHFTEDQVCVFRKKEPLVDRTENSHTPWFETTPAHEVVTQVPKHIPWFEQGTVNELGANHD